MQEPKKKKGSEKTVATKEPVNQAIIDEINKRAKEGFEIGSRTNTYLDDSSPVVQDIGIDQYGQVVDFGDSQYDTPDLNPEELLLGGLDEIRAQKQSNLDRWGNAIPRLVSKVGTEIAKTPGYIYALGEAGLTESTLAEALDNAWLNTLQSLDDSVKEEFAIYKPESVKNGSLWDNITSTSFWTDEGVDGAGYLISMMAPGAALKAAGMAGKIAKLGTTVKMANNIELGTATVLNTTLESLGETKGIADNLKLEFNNKIEKGEINPNTGNPWTPEEADIAINEAAQGVFMNNMALLLAPNLIMNKNLLGRFVPTKNALNKGFDKAGNFVETSPVTKKQMLGEYAKTIGTGIFSEGFVEEAGQFAVEQYYDKLAKGETDDNLITGLINEYGNALSTTEGQKSIFLGAFLGGLGSIRGTKRFKQEADYTSKISKMLKDNYEGFSASIDDIYVKDDNGELVLKDNQVQVNPVKLAQAVSNIALENKSSLMKDVYAMLGNKEAYDFISNQEFTRFAIPYLKEDGGLELLNKHIDLLSNKLIESRNKVGEEVNTLEEAKYINELKQKAKKLQDIYTNTDDLISKINIAQFNDNPELASQFLNNLSSSAFQEVSKQFFLTDKINELNNEVLQLENGTASALPQVQFEINGIKDQIVKYQDALNESIDTYKSIFDSNEISKAYDEYVDNISKLEDKVEKATKEVEKKESEKPEYTYNGKPVVYAYTSKETGEKYYKDPEGKSKVRILEKNLDQNKEEVPPIVPLEDKDSGLNDLSSKLSALSQEASTSQPIQEKTIDSFADDIIGDTDLSSLEDQQFYDNNKEAIEKELQNRASEESTKAEVKFKALNKNVFNRFHSSKITPEGKHLVNSLDFNSPSVQDNLKIEIIEKPYEADDKSLIQTHEISLFYRDTFLGYLMNPDALVNVDSTVEENNAYIAEQRELNRELFNYLINSGKKSYKVKDLVEKGLFTLTTSGGSINQFKGDAKNRPLISDYLDIIMKDEKGNPIIVDSKDPDIPVLIGLEKEIEELVPDAGYPNPAITDRYTVAVKQSNGKVQWISAQPATLEDEAYSPLINNYKEQSNKAFKTNSSVINDNKINDKFNYEKDQVYFITIPSDIKPTVQTISVDAGIKGGLVIDVEYREGDKHDKVYIPNKDVQKITSAEDLFDLLNEYNDLDILKNYTFDKNNFRKKVSLDSAKDAASQLQMNLDVESPFKDNTVILNFSKGIIPSSDKKVVTEPEKEVKKEINEVESKPEINDKKAARLAYIQGRLADPNITTPEFTALVTELEEIQRNFPNNGGTVFKLSEDSSIDKINIEEATNWITERLPDNISVSDVMNITDNVTKGATWGAFRDGVIYLSKEAGKGTEYHEAFHGVFRTLLNDRDIRRYLRLAQLERGLPTTKEIDNARKKYNLSDNISHQEISDILLEEYLADRFMNWVKSKDAKTLPGLKGLFQKIWNWIQFTLLNRDSMESLFYNIENGSFKNKQAVLNRFDKPYGAYAYMIIPAGIDSNGNSINLNSADTEKLIATTALDLFKLKIDSYTDKDNNELLDELLDTYKAKSSLREPMNISLMSLLDSELRADFVKQLIKESHIFTNKASRNLLKKEVLKRFKIFNFDTELNEEDIQDLANTVGDRFDRNASNIGGFGTLSKAIRQLISLTTIEEVDKYGRNITRAIDVPTVYNGIERVLANTEKKDMLKKLRSYSEYNPEVAAFYNKLKDLVNYDEVNDTWDDNSTYNSFVTAFNKARVYYLFSLIDPKNNTYRVGNANQRDVGITQVSKWSNNYEFNVSDKKEAIKKLSKLTNKYLKPSKELKEKINKPIVDKATDELKSAFNNIGIELSKGYIKYSILQNRELTDEQSEYLKTFEDTFPIQGTDGQNLIQLLELFKEGNPYLKSDIDGITRLRNIADGNAVFDETVGSSNFQNAEGETVYDKILASYTIRRTNSYHNNPNALNTKSFDAFKEGHPYLSKYDSKNLFELLKKNPLVNNPNANVIFDKDFVVKIIDGVRQASLNTKDGKSFEDTRKTKKEGKTFKKMQLRDTLLTMYGLYNNSKYKTITNEDGTKSKVKFSDYYFKVLEASSTGYTISLPERSLWKNGLTKQAKDDLYSFFEQEFDRITRGYSEISKIEKALENNEKPSIPVIKGYHNGSKRAINFWNFKFLSEDIRNELQKLAENKESIPEELTKRIEKEIENNYISEFRDHINKLKDLDIITQKVNAEGKNIPDTFNNALLPNSFTKEVNGDKIVDLNEVGNFFFNDMINSWSYNQLIDGDWAISRKDEVDFVKRNKGSIAMQETFGEGVSKGAIIREPYSSDGIQQADAQMWESLDWRIHKLKSLGKFNAEVKEVYDKIYNDEDLTDNDLKKLNENDATLISDKDVYFDGIHYFKLSSFPLTRAYTSIKVDSNTNNAIKGKNGKYYIPLPGREFEFNLQNEIENKGISYVMPESASKGATKDVSELGDLRANEYQNVYWGKQVATPSGKTYITEPTQKDGLIDSEQDKSLEPIINKRQELISQRLEVLYEQNLNQLKDQLSDSKEYTIKYILDRFRNTLEDSGADPNLIEFFSKDDNGNPKFNLNMPITISKFEQLFYAHFTKDGLSVKSPGYALILKSDYGVKVARKNGKVVTSKDLTRGVKYDELTDLKHDVKDEDGNVYSEVLLPAHFKEMYNLNIGESLNGDILKMLGMRIPTQDKHSMMNLKVVDFLPAQYGSIIIAPKEIVKLSGADFDVDKLYVRRYEHYIDNDGNIKIYGRNGNDIDTRWEEFVKYQKENNKQFDKTISEKDALLRLGMPTNKSEYAKVLKEKGEQNLAILHNEILTTELKLYGNESIREIANTPATLDALQELVSEIGIDSNINNYSVNSVNGKLASKNDIDTGAENIGPAANANMIFNLLAKNNIELFDESGIEFNGTIYNTFKYINSEGKRINDLISTILSAMTDNAKEALAGKFNLTLDTLQPALYMVSLGVPLKDVLRMTTSDILVEYTNKLSKIKGGVKTAVEENLNEARIAEELIKKYNDLLEVDSTGNISKNLETFNKFLEFQKQSKMFFKISGFIQLNKGFKPSVSENNLLNLTAEELGINKDVEIVKELGVPFDINPILKGNNQIAKQYEIYKKVHNEVAKEFFINKSNLFNYVKSLIVANTKIGKVNSQDLLNSLDRNLLTYINVNAYKKYLTDNLKSEENAEKAIKTLNPNVVFGDLFDTIKKLKADNPNNKLFQYISLEQSSDVKSLSFNVIASNNRIKVHPVILEQILNAYNELFSNPDTKQVAIDLFNYMVIKDGMQFKNKSISKFIAPFMYRMISNSLDNTISVVKDNAISDEIFSDVFGVNKKAFINQFVNTVFEYEPNSFDYIPYHGKSIDESIMTKDGSDITIDLFNNYKFKKKPTTSEELLDELKEEDNTSLKDNINAVTKSRALQLKSKEGKLYIEFPLYIKIGNETFKVKAIGNSFDIKESDNLLDFIGTDNKTSNFNGFTTKAIYTKVDTFGDESFNPYASTLAENKEVDKLIKESKSKKIKPSPIENVEFAKTIDISEDDLREAERISKLLDSDSLEKDIDSQLSQSSSISEEEFNRIANQLSMFSQEGNLGDLNEGNNIIDEDEDPLTPC